jgi:hypothetical protein
MESADFGRLSAIPPSVREPGDIATQRADLTEVVASELARAGAESEPASPLPARRPWIAVAAAAAVLVGWWLWPADDPAAQPLDPPAPTSVAASEPPAENPPAGPAIAQEAPPVAEEPPPSAPASAEVASPSAKKRHETAPKTPGPAPAVTPPPVPKPKSGGLYGRE